MVWNINYYLNEGKLLDMNRQEATQKIMEAKIAKGLTWEEISKVSENSETWVVTALLGQATMTRPEAEKIGKLLELDEEVVQALTVVPLRGQVMQMPPTDPILYRLYEMMLQYAPTLRELILEKAGEGVMSAINFNLGVDTQEDPKGGDPRIVITLNGKFLPFRTW
ncbi:cyanate lyase [Bacillus sp. RC250]|uniref:Cyanate hydratase n=17 Tax=Bacillus cereus group TaxID=86661 RepID=J8EF95_BACCE|nr:cyanate hydratase [Bacillus cereus HuA4-10]